jgi:hypothetical protein
MKHFTVYNAAGEILRSGLCQDDMVEAQAHADGELSIEAESDPEFDAVLVSTAEVVMVVIGGKPPPPIDMDYASARVASYPKVSEQLDMLWHAMDAFQIPRAEPFYSRIKATKDAYPKDNSVVPGSVIIYPAE